MILRIIKILVAALLASSSLPGAAPAPWPQAGMSAARPYASMQSTVVDAAMPARGAGYISNLRAVTKAEPVVVVENGAHFSYHVGIDGRLRRFSHPDLIEQWTHHLGAGVHAAPAADATGVFVADTQGGITAIDNSGNILWVDQLPGPILASPVLVLFNNLSYLIVADILGSVRMYDLAACALAGLPVSTWATIDVQAPVVGLAVDEVVRQALYVLTRDAKIHAFNLADGNSHWAAPFVLPDAPVTVLSWHAGRGLVLVGLVDGRVIAVAAADGAQLWQSVTLAKLQNHLSLDADFAYAAAVDGMVFKINLIDGTNIAMGPYGNPGSGPTLSDLGLFVPRMDGILTLLNPLNLSLIKNYELNGHPLEAPVVLAGSRINLADNSGSLGVWGLAAANAEITSPADFSRVDPLDSQFDVFGSVQVDESLNSKNLQWKVQVADVDIAGVSNSNARINELLETVSLGINGLVEGIYKLRLRFNPGEGDMFTTDKTFTVGRMAYKGSIARGAVPGISYRGIQWSSGQIRAGLQAADASGDINEYLIVQADAPGGCAHLPFVVKMKDGLISAQAVAVTENLTCDVPYYYHDGILIQDALGRIVSISKIITGGEVAEIKVFDLDLNELGSQMFPVALGNIDAAALAQDGTLAVQYAGGNVKIYNPINFAGAFPGWDLMTPKAQWSLQVGGSSVRGMGFTAADQNGDFQIVATNGTFGELILLDPDNGQVNRVLVQDTAGTDILGALAVDASGRFVAVANDLSDKPPNVTIYDIETGTEIYDLARFGSQFSTSLFRPHWSKDGGLTLTTLFLAEFFESGIEEPALTLSGSEFAWISPGGGQIRAGVSVDNLDMWLLESEPVEPGSFSLMFAGGSGPLAPATVVDVPSDIGANGIYRLKLKVLDKHHNEFVKETFISKGVFQYNGEIGGVWSSYAGRPDAFCNPIGLVHFTGGNSYAADFSRSYLTEYDSAGGFSRIINLPASGSVEALEQGPDNTMLVLAGPQTAPVLTVYDAQGQALTVDFQGGFGTLPLLGTLASSFNHDRLFLIADGGGEVRVYDMQLDPGNSSLLHIIYSGTWRPMGGTRGISAVDQAEDGLVYLAINTNIAGLGDAPLWVLDPAAGGAVVGRLGNKNDFLFNLKTLAAGRDGNLYATAFDNNTKAVLYAINPRDGRRFAALGGDQNSQEGHFIWPQRINIADDGEVFVSDRQFFACGADSRGNYRISRFIPHANAFEVAILSPDTGRLSGQQDITVRVGMDNLVQWNLDVDVMGAGGGPATLAFGTEYVADEVVASMNPAVFGLEQVLELKLHASDDDNLEVNDRKYLSTSSLVFERATAGAAPTGTVGLAMNPVSGALWLARQGGRVDQVLSAGTLIGGFDTGLVLRDIAYEAGNTPVIHLLDDQLQVHHFDTFGVLTGMTALAGAGSADWLEVDDQGRLWIWDSASGLVRVFNQAGQELYKINENFNVGAISVSPITEGAWILTGAGKVFRWNVGTQQLDRGFDLKTVGFVNPTDIAADSSGRLFVGDSGTGKLAQVSAGGDRVTWLGGAGTEPSRWGLLGPADIAVGNLGLSGEATVIAMDTSNERIQQYTAFGGDLKLFVELPDKALATGNLLNLVGAVESDQNLSYSLKVVGSQAALPLDIQGAGPVPAGSTLGTLDLATLPSLFGGLQDFFKVTLDANFETAVRANTKEQWLLPNPWDLAPFVMDGPAFEFQKVFNGTTSVVGKFAVLASGDIVVNTKTSGAQDLRHYSKSGNLLAPPLALGFEARDIAADGANQAVFMSSAGTGGIVARWDAASNNVVNFVTGLNDPRGIAVAGGVLFVAERTAARISRFDTTTGTPLGSFGSGLLSEPSMIAVSPGGLMAIVDDGLRRIYLLDSVTGDLDRVINIDASTASTPAGVFNEGQISILPVGQDRLAVLFLKNQQLRLFGIHGEELPGLSLSQYFGTTTVTDMDEHMGSLVIGSNVNRPFPVIKAFPTLTPTPTCTDCHALYCDTIQSQPQGMPAESLGFDLKYVESAEVVNAPFGYPGKMMRSFTSLYCGSFTIVSPELAGQTDLDVNLRVAAARVKLLLRIDAMADNTSGAVCNNCYEAAVDVASGTVEIAKYVNKIRSVLAGPSAVAGLSEEGMQIRATAAGNQIEVFINGAAVPDLTATDTANSAPFGTIGIVSCNQILYFADLTVNPRVECSVPPVVTRVPTPTATVTPGPVSCTFVHTFNQDFESGLGDGQVNISGGGLSLAGQAEPMLPTKSKPDLPLGVWAPAAWVHAGHLFVAGGFKPGIAYANDVYSRPIADAAAPWTALPVLPKAQAYSASATWRNYTYIAGGKSSDVTHINRVYAGKMDSNGGIVPVGGDNWREYILPFGSSKLAVSIVFGQLLVLDFINQQRMWADIQADGSLGTFTVEADPFLTSAGAFSHAMGRIWILKSVVDGKGLFSAPTSRDDILGEWVPSGVVFPVNTDNFTLAENDVLGRIYMVGGNNGSSWGSNAVFSTVPSADGTATDWTLEGLTIPTRFHTTLAVDKGIFILGGVEKPKGLNFIPLAEGETVAEKGIYQAVFDLCQEEDLALIEWDVNQPDFAHVQVRTAGFDGLFGSWTDASVTGATQLAINTLARFVEYRFELGRPATGNVEVSQVRLVTTGQLPPSSPTPTITPTATLTLTPQPSTAAGCALGCPYLFCEDFEGPATLTEKGWIFSSPGDTFTIFADPVFGSNSIELNGDPWTTLLHDNPDEIVDVDISVRVRGGTFTALLARASDSISANGFPVQGYRFAVKPDPGPAGGLLVILNSGTLDLGSASIPTPTGSSYTMRFTVIGSVLTGYVNGEEVLSRVNATHPNAGNFGMMSFTGAVFDDFTVNKSLECAPSPTPTPLPELSIVVSSDQLAAAAGDLVTYKISYQNGLAGGLAKGFKITADVPMFGIYDSAGAFDGRALVVSQPNPGETSGTVTWALDDIDPGSGGQVELVLQVDASLATGSLLMQENFEAPRYNPNDFISSTQPATWSTDPGTDSKYQVLPDPLGFGDSMAAVKSSLNQINGGVPFSQAALSTVQNFTDTAFVRIEFIAPSPNMQDFFIFGGFRMSIDGGFLRLQTSLDELAGRFLFPFNQVLVLEATYMADTGSTHAKVFRRDLQPGEPEANRLVLEGSTAKGGASASYKMLMINTSVNMQTDGYMYVDDIQVCRSLAVQANLSTPLNIAIATEVSVGGVTVGCQPIQTPVLTPTQTAVPGMTIPGQPQINGAIFAMAQVGDIIYLGGQFTEIGGVAVQNLAAIYAQGHEFAGQVVSDFKPSVNGPVFAIDVLGDTVYFGGEFTQVNGFPRFGLAAVLAVGHPLMGEITPWDPAVSASVVYALLASPGAIYVGGEFQQVGGQARQNLAALDPVLGQALPFVANANGTVRALALFGDILYVGGDFDFIGLDLVLAVAAVDTLSGNLVPGFTAGLLGSVRSLATDGNQLYIGGEFSRVNGGLRGGLAAVDLVDGSLKPWDPQIQGEVCGLSLFGDRLYVTGSFISAGGEQRSSLAAVESSTGSVTGWAPTVNQKVCAVIASDNAVYVGGEFDQLNGLPQDHFGVLGPDSGPAPTPSFTQTPTPSQTVTFSVTPSMTQTITPSMTSSFTITSTLTHTSTISPTPTATITPTRTETLSFTLTHSMTSTSSPSSTATVTPTHSPTASPTASPTQSIPCLAQAVLAEYGDVLLKNTALIEGDVRASGSVNLQNSAQISGQIIEGSGIGALPFEPPAGAHDLGDLEVKHSQVLALSSGDYLVGNLTVSNSGRLEAASGRVRLWVTGKAEFKNDSVTGASQAGDFWIFLTGSATSLAVKNSARLTAAVYAPASEVVLRNSAQVYGAVVGATVEMKNSAQVHYEAALGFACAFAQPTLTWTPTPVSGQGSPLLSALGRTDPLDFELPAGIDLVAAPNPVRGEGSNLFFRVHHSGDARILVYNLAGEPMGIYALGALARGGHTQFFDTRRLSSGIYLLVLQVDEGWGPKTRARFKLAVIH